MAMTKAERDVLFQKMADELNYIYHDAPKPPWLCRPHWDEEQYRFDVSQFTADTYKGEPDV